MRELSSGRCARESPADMGRASGPDWGTADLSRIAAPNGDFAFYHGRAMGQIIDINRHGLASCYFHDKTNGCTGPFPPEDGEVDIISAGRIHLQALPARIIANFETGPVTPSYPQVSQWKCRLYFRQIVNDHVFLLKRYLQDCRDIPQVGKLSRKYLVHRERGTAMLNAAGMNAGSY